MHEKKNIRIIIQKYKNLLLSERSPKCKDVDLKELGSLAHNFEEFLFSDINSVCSKGSLLLKLTESIVNFGIVQAFEGIEDKDFCESDFPVQAEQAGECFEYLTPLLVHFNSVEISFKRKFLVLVLVLCGTHHDRYLWSSEKSVAQCSDFLSSLLTVTKHNSLNDLLIDDTYYPTVFKALLRWMRPSLMKETWMKKPSSCHIFYWFLSHVKHPHLVDYLQDILPPAFMFTSYHAAPQIALGLKCFDHILDNVPPTPLKNDGYDEVIFDTLKRLSLFHKEKDFVKLMYPCILKLDMVNSGKADQTKWLPYDVILQQLLENAAMEYDPEMRCIYLSHLSLFMSTAPCFKHLTKVLDVIFTNLTFDSTLGEECRILSLKLLKEVIQTCWPRIENHFFNIMLSLLKVLHDTETPDENIKEPQLKSLCEECFCLLKFACPETFENQVKEYLQEEEQALPGQSYLKTLIEARRNE